MTIVLAVLFGCFLAYANGANDNFKGVATLYGSGRATYRGALAIAAVAQVLGSIVSLIVAQGLLATFSGRGLVPDAVVAMKAFTLSVGLAAALTVLVATILGFPISTTHALTGALAGAGLWASSSGVDLSKLQSTFLAPLLLSPLVSAGGGALAYLAFRRLTVVSGIERETCICVGTEVIEIVPSGVAPAQALSAFQARTVPTMSISTRVGCVERYRGNVFGVRASSLLDGFHYATGAAVCFARALNDTPKIAAVLLVAGALSPSFAIAAVTGAMVMGGVLNARKIAETMSHKVTTMNAEQGFSANVVTAALVIVASRLGLPVSTTHVSVGSLFGIGAVTGQVQWRVVVQILFAWITTVPVAALLAAVLFGIFRQLF